MKEQDKKAVKFFWTVICALAIGYIALSYDASQPVEESNKTVKPGYAACIQDELLTQFITGSERMQTQLLEQRLCVATNLLAYEFDVLGWGSFGVRHVRVWLPDDQSVDVYLPMEAVQ